MLKKILKALHFYKKENKQIKLFYEPIYIVEENNLIWSEDMLDKN